MVQPLSFPPLLSSKTTNKNNTPTLFLGFVVDAEDDPAADPADPTADPASTKKMITNAPTTANTTTTKTTLQELWYRWKALEVWSELAIRPTECHPEDRFLFQGKDDVDDDDMEDDVPAIQHQGRVVQRLFNKHLSTLPVETTVWDPSLIVKPSQIPTAGHGLYYAPPKEEEGVIPPNTLICYYTGHVHTYASAAAAAGSISEEEEDDDDDELAQQQQQQQAAEIAGDERPRRTKPKTKKKERDRSYLMWIRDNILVDPLRCKQIKARYINDPLNDDCRNCHYVPTRIPPRPTTTTNNIPPHPETIRTGVVTTRAIRPGEELFVSYGEAYWNDPHNQNANFVGTRFEPQKKMKKNDTKKKVCGDTKYNNNKDDTNDTNDDDDDNDIDDDDELASLFPLSSKLFQTKLMAESIDWD